MFLAIFLLYYKLGSIIDPVDLSYAYLTSQTYKLIKRKVGRKLTIKSMEACELWYMENYIYNSKHKHVIFIAEIK